MPHIAGVPKLVVVAVFLSVLYGLAEVLFLTMSEHKGHMKGLKCQKDGEGSWSIGTFYGFSPFDLVPLEKSLPRHDTAFAWPAANPVITCATIAGDVSIPTLTTSHSWRLSHTPKLKPAGTFAADPFLFIDGSDTYIFYESKSAADGQGDIAVAVSHDGGANFTSLGVVVDEDWHVSYPFIFRYQGQIYMVPEGSASGKVWLYNAIVFPTLWGRLQMLIDRPLIDPSLVEWQGKWWMFASDRGRPSERGCLELEVWYAESPLGPWKLAGGKPAKEGVVGSRNAGRPFVYNGQLYRLGQDCQKTYGHRLRAYRVVTLTAHGHYAEEEVPLPFLAAETAKGERHWSGVRHHHMDVTPVNMVHNGTTTATWMAAVDGDRHVSNYVMMDIWARLRRTLLALLLTALGVDWLWRRNKSLLGQVRQSMWRSTDRPLLRTQHSKIACPPPAFVEAFVETDAEGGRKASIAPATSDTWTCVVATVAAVVGGLAAVVWAVLWFLVTYCKWQVIMAVIWYVNTWGGPPDPIAVAGEYSKFTLMVMSYEVRTMHVSAYVKHYSRCPSVSDIVVVWNEGKPPNVSRMDSAVPVRVRVEPNNSMNNRYKPDPLITNRAVLSLDDDIYLPCSDIERAFAIWRTHPERITGFYIRILEGEWPDDQCENHCERHTVRSGLYNIVFAGAAFIDRDFAFNAYWADDNAKGRALVDELFNCDDLLLNFLLARKYAGRQYVQFVRPTKRIDVGKLSSKQLSSNHRVVRHMCNKRLNEMFDRPLHKGYPIEWGDFGKPSCELPTVGCAYI